MNGDAVPVTLDEELPRLAAEKRLLVALDFDGTLAPLVDDPADSRAIPEASAAIDRLILLPDTRVALISGRAAASLLQVSGAPGNVLIVGSHGAETRLDAPEVRIDLDTDERQRVRAVSGVLNEIAARFAGVWVEDKPAGSALHTRLASDADQRAADLLALEQVPARVGTVTTRGGKNVLEFSVRSADKGQAVALLRRHTRATAVLFAGDDVTDEDGFAALTDTDLGVKVGPGATRARVRVGSPEALAGVLHRLADLRIEHTDATNVSPTAPNVP